MILNESAGTAERHDAGSLRETLAASFDEHGIAARFSCVPGPELKEAAQRALQAVERGELDAVAVGGGDGSIRTVAGVMAGSDVPLGIIPLGTLNHFARDLALPLEVSDAVAVIAAADTRLVDVAEVNGHVFINNSSIGLYPSLVLARERKRPGTWMPKWAAMILAIPETIRYWPLFRLTIQVEGNARQYRSPIVFVGNNEYQLTLPTVGSRERLDRGELWIYVANADGWLTLLLVAVRFILGLGGRVEEACTFRGTAAEITTWRHHVLVACDGEVERMRPPLRYRCRSKALRVFAPPSKQ